MYRLDQQQIALVETVRQIADQSIAPQAADVDAASHFPHAAMDALAQAGFLGLTVPSEYGGMGQGLGVFQ
jgi:isovaleryl-CoA dehydrogenase